MRLGNARGTTHEATHEARRTGHRLAGSLELFVGRPAYGITQLRQDLERFTFLLGDSDGEQLFGLPPE